MSPEAPWVGLFDSFADGTPGGNVAAVVLSDEPLAEATMAAAARRLAVSTTGFVTVDAAARRGIATVRFFTPEQEIDACGHVTIAVAQALRLRRVWPADPTERTILASGGRFIISVDQVGGTDVIEMRQRLGYLADPGLDSARVSDLLGRLELRHDLPLRTASTGLRHLVVPAVSVGRLAALTPQPHAVAELAGLAGVDTVAVFAIQETTGGVARVRLRDLCAGIGDLEEPASGTTAGALAAYLRDRLPQLATLSSSTPPTDRTSGCAELPGSSRN